LDLLIKVAKQKIQLLHKLRLPAALQKPGQFRFPVTKLNRLEEILAQHQSSYKDDLRELKKQRRE
jgi:hypothetical protein